MRAGSANDTPFKASGATTQQIAEENAILERSNSFRDIRGIYQWS